MSGQTVPQAIDQRIDELVGLIHGFELGQLAAPQVLEHLQRAVSIFGLAILPRKKVLTA
jgi:hypothetical protein